MPKSLHYLVLNGDYDAIKQHLEKGSSEINQPGRYDKFVIKVKDYKNYFTVGDAPLTIAILKNDIKAACLLVQYGADINTWINEGNFKNMTNFTGACMLGNLELAKAIAETAKNFNVNQVSNFSLRVLDENYCFYNITPLGIACLFGDIYLTSYLLKIGADPSMIFFLKNKDQEITPLAAAALMGHADIIGTLLKNRAIISQPLKSSLFWTSALNIAIASPCAPKQFLILKEIIDINIDQPDNFHNTVLGYAVNATTDAICNSYGIENTSIKLLIDAGANVNCKFNGKPILNLAIEEFSNLASENQITIIKWLIAKNVDPRIKADGPEGKSALELSKNDPVTHKLLKDVAKRFGGFETKKQLRYLLEVREKQIAELLKPKPDMKDAQTQTEEQQEGAEINALPTLRH